MNDFMIHSYWPQMILFTISSKFSQAIHLQVRKSFYWKFKQFHDKLDLISISIIIFVPLHVAVVCSHTIAECIAEEAFLARTTDHALLCTNQLKFFFQFMLELSHFSDILI